MQWQEVDEKLKEEDATVGRQDPYSADDLAEVRHCRGAQPCSALILSREIIMGSPRRVWGFLCVSVPCWQSHNVRQNCSKVWTRALKLGVKVMPSVLIGERKPRALLCYLRFCVDLMMALRMTAV